jgi:hypothetical protein
MNSARGYCLFRRPHHQRVHKLLQALNAPLLNSIGCFFGGGTAIVLLLGEYRESVDVDLLCASSEGYRTLRNIVSERSLGQLLTEPVELARDVRADRYGIRTFCKIEDTPIKLEIVREDRIQLTGEAHPLLPVTALSRVDMYAEKLLANADRWADRGTASRDAIDLAMMIKHWGDIPAASWAKATQAYGDSVAKALVRARDLLSEPTFARACLTKMGMDPSLETDIQLALQRGNPPTL